MCPLLAGHGEDKGGHRACPHRRKPNPNLSLKWVAREQKADVRPLASVRWAAVRVRFNKNKRAQTECVGALELPLLPPSHNIVHIDLRESQPHKF